MFQDGDTSTILAMYIEHMAANDETGKDAYHRYLLLSVARQLAKAATCGQITDIYFLFPERPTRGHRAAARSPLVASPCGAHSLHASPVHDMSPPGAPAMSRKQRAWPLVIMLSLRFANVVQVQSTLTTDRCL